MHSNLFELRKFLLILQLIEEGQVKLDGKLLEYLPEFYVEGAENITIHQLLTHTAGITGHPRISNLLDIEKQHYTREEFLRLITNYDLVYEPSEGTEYSNFGYGLLGLVIEKVTGKSYDEVMNEQRKVIYQRRDQILQGLDLKLAAMDYLA